MQYRVSRPNLGRFVSVCAHLSDELTLLRAGWMPGLSRRAAIRERRGRVVAKRRG